MASYQVKIVCLCLGALFLAADSKSIKKEQDETEPFTFQDFIDGAYSARSFNGSWLSDTTLFYKNPAGDVLSFDVINYASTPLLDHLVLANFTGSSITFSADQLYVLIRYNASSVFRHSTTAQFTICDVTQKTYLDIANKASIQIAQWAPVGHSLVYVHDNNIFYLRNPEDIDNPIPVTTDGVSGIIYNGVPDWVYEEEVLGTGTALWFSPDGNNLAYASFDDTEVHEFDYFLYGEPGTLASQYPTLARIRYPKVGTPNPKVSVYVADLQSTKSLVKKLKVDNFKQPLPDEYILYDISWPKNDEVAVIISNRVQNVAVLSRCPLTGECVVEANYEETRGWLDVYIPVYDKSGDRRLEILSRSVDDDFYNQIVLTDVVTQETNRLVSGKIAVTSINGWDEVKNLVYFTGSGEGKPSEQHVYVVNVNSAERQCITCDIETSAGLCKYASASFSTNLSYVAVTCQGPGPYLTQIQKAPNVIGGKIKKFADEDALVWENNDALITKLQSKSWPIVKDLKVPLPDGFEANVRLLLPPDFDENAATKYAAVVYVYAGPDSNQIADTYSAGWDKYIVTNRKYIYILIDGRGSGRDGKNKIFQVYRKLATVEIQDQIAVTKYLQQNLPYIDAENTGIWGWSYGGFATAWVLVQDTENVFKFGVSVAPVTSFIYYDSIYTERYMGLPTEEDNLAGYNGTDVSRNVESLRGKQYFLIHGNGDDNVHYQQSMLLSKALERADIPFRQQSYPDENHSLGNVSPHVYHNLDKFWANSFGLPDPPVTKVQKKQKKKA